MIIVYKIYGPNHYRDKEVCWCSLQTNMESVGSNKFIIGGDLNLVMHPKEKRGGNYTPNPSRDQLECIMRDHDLVDIIPRNRSYTWNNRRIGPSNIMERMDRTLVAVSLITPLNISTSSILSCSASDYYTISLFLGGQSNFGPLPFCFNLLWCDFQEARAIIESTWCAQVEGSPLFRWETKLKPVHTALRKWAKEH